MFHEAGRASDLAALMLPDDDASWDGAKDRSAAPRHMKDITHQPLCLYMEFLSRILDAHKVAGRRWFLGAVTSNLSGLKGRL
jgi:hypothetical protein